MPGRDSAGQDSDGVPKVTGGVGVGDIPSVCVLECPFVSTVALSNGRFLKLIVAPYPKAAPFVGFGISIAGRPPQASSFEDVLAEDVRAMLRDEDVVVLVAENDEGPLGYISGTIENDERREDRLGPFRCRLGRVAHVDNRRPGVGLLVAAFYEKRYELLQEAFQDVLHQPVRSKLFPEMYLLLDAATNAGAYGSFLSGGGSTVAALSAPSESQSVLAALRSCATKNGLRFQDRISKIGRRGAYVVDTKLENA